MRFTQHEIIEIQKIASTELVPMKFSVDGNNSIDFDFANDTSIQVILKKDDQGYLINGTKSNGDGYHQQVPNFEQFRHLLRNWVRAIKRDNPYEIEKLASIDQLSEKFYSTFHEARIIDELGFNDSAGMIYRKALELVVKDFLKQSIPTEQETIESKTIRRIIYHFYEQVEGNLAVRKKEKFSDIKSELETIRQLVIKISNTFKIGNDFSHYQRSLEQFSSKDMRENILLIISYINNLLESQILRIERDNLDNKFQEEGLI